MNFDPLLHASLAVQIHVATVVAAFFLGAWQIFLSTKGSTLHRKVGSVYIGLMLVTAVAAFLSVRQVFRECRVIADLRLSICLCR